MSSSARRDFDPDKAAAALQEARAAGRRIETLPAAIAPRDEAEGAAAQRELARRTGALPPGGFKIGATGRRMQQYLGLSGPAAGFMAQRDIHGGEATLRFADYLNPGVECELAVRLARDLPPGPCTPAEAEAAVEDLVAAIEIVDNRYRDLTALGTPALIADQVFHAAAVTGDRAQHGWRTLDVPRLKGRISIDGAVRDEGVASDLLGHPCNCLAWLAGSEVAKAFGGLKAGQVIMLGSVTPPVWLDRPALVTVEFPPLPPVRVRVS
jgi:2-keto-4-pentenoate hydratase